MPTEQILKKIYETVSEGVIIFDSYGTIIETNPKAYAILNYKRNGLTLYDLVVDQGYRKRTINLLREGEPVTYRVVCEHDNGRAYVEIRLSPLSFDGKTFYYADIRDLTERKITQLRSEALRRMRSLGLLSSHVAHRFNDLLSVVFSFIDITKRTPNTPEAITKYVELLAKEAEQVQNLTNKLLTFSRRRRANRGLVNVNEIIERIKIKTEDIIIKKSLDRSAPLVEGDEKLILQALTTLIQNATEAIPQKGEITLSTKVIKKDRGTSSVLSFIPPGNYLKVTVSDNGKGIQKEHLPYIFEPFFTKKRHKPHAGIDLSTVYGIIKLHGGYIDIQSGSGKTSFDIYFPL